MSIAKEAFEKLYPEKTLKYKLSLKYSAKFKPYNANVKKYQRIIEFSLSPKWKEVSPEIVIGLIQVLLIKLFKTKKHTINTDLYNSFIKNLHISIPKEHSDPILLESFNRVNEKYFYSLIEAPNLKWGSHSRRELGSYNYHTDTIKVSRIFLNSGNEILDYIMYHELLHKKLKFQGKSARNYHHTSEFKVEEKQFENYPEMEKRIAELIRKSRYRSFLSGFNQ